jgi:hypothetical protein
VIAVDDLSERSLRELMALARARLGREARALKTRAELVAALRAEPRPSPDTPAPAAPVVVTRDFFVARAGEGRRAAPAE